MIFFAAVQRINYFSLFLLLCIVYRLMLVNKVDKNESVRSVVFRSYSIQCLH